jgi:tetratricopeptide (TPR) repeat protein
MAYFDMGKYAEAEPWLNKARATDKTMTASEYNLGRIAFETKRYGEAAKHFDNVLAKDPNNVMALKAAAYTGIKIGKFEKAQTYYGRVLALVPESADDGYNYALVLFAVEKYEDAETTLLKYPASLADNNDSILLHARVQKALKKPEAIDTYAKYLESNKDAKVRYEYAACLEQTSLYARALEEYRTAYKDISADSKMPSKAEVRYALAKVLLIADSENDEGITELKGAVVDGFADFDAMKTLLDETAITEAHKKEIQAVIDDPEALKAAAKAAGTASTPAETPEADASPSATDAPPADGETAAPTGAATEKAAAEKTSAQSVPKEAAQ